MGGGGGGQRDHPVRAKSAGGRIVAAGPCRRAGPTGAGPRHDPRAAVARQACPDSHGGDAGITYDAAPGSSEIPPRLAADVDTGGGVGTTPRAGRRGPALVVVDAGASHDADGSAGGGPEIYLPLADRRVSPDAEERLSYRGPTARKMGEFGKGGRDVHQRGSTDCGVAGPGGAGAGRAGHGVAERGRMRRLGGHVWHRARGGAADARASSIVDRPSRRSPESSEGRDARRTDLVAWPAGLDVAGRGLARGQTLRKSMWVMVRRKGEQRGQASLVGHTSNRLRPRRRGIACEGFESPWGHV